MVVDWVLAVKVWLAPRVLAVVGSSAQRAVTAARRVARMEDLAHAKSAVSSLLEVLRQRRPIPGDRAKVRIEIPNVRRAWVAAGEQCSA